MRTLLLSFCLVACSSTPTSAPVAASQQPAWIARGSGAFSKPELVLLGVGVSTGIKNPKLRTMTAVNRARAEIAKVWETVLASMLKDFYSNEARNDEPRAEEQQVEGSIKTYHAPVLDGVTIVDTWLEPETNAEYALAQLRRDDIIVAIDKGIDNTKIREHFKKRIDDLFRDLDQ